MGGIMDKKNLMGVVFLVSVLGVVLTGMSALQPEKPAIESEPTEYAMGGFPVVPSLRE
jgi:hypothetical protein